MPPKKKRTAPIVVGTVSTRSTRRESIVNIQITPKINKTSNSSNLKSAGNLNDLQSGTALSEAKNVEILELLKDWSDEDSNNTDDIEPIYTIKNINFQNEVIEQGINEKQSLLDILEGDLVEANDKRKSYEVEHVTKSHNLNLVQVQQKNVADCNKQNSIEDRNECFEKNMKKCISDFSIPNINKLIPTKSENQSETSIVCQPASISDLVDEDIIYDESTHLVLSETNEIVIGEENSNNSEIGLQSIVDDSNNIYLKEIETFSSNEFQGKLTYNRTVSNLTIDSLNLSGKNEHREVALEEKIQRLTLIEKPLCTLVYNEQCISENKLEGKLQISETSESSAKNYECKDVIQKCNKQDNRQYKNAQEINFDNITNLECQLKDTDMMCTFQNHDAEIQEVSHLSNISSDLPDMLHTSSVGMESCKNNEKKSLEVLNCRDSEHLLNVIDQSEEIKKMEICDNKRIKSRKNKKFCAHENSKNTPLPSKRTDAKKRNRKFQNREGKEEVRRSNRIKSICGMKKRNSGRGLVKSKSESALNESELDELVSNSDSEKCTSHSGTLNQKTRTKTVNRAKSCEDIFLDSNTNLVQDNKCDNLAIVSSNSSKKSKVPRADPEVFQRLKQFQHLKENLYKTDRQICKEAKKMICDCFITEDEIKSGEFGCGEDCLNRLLMIECSNLCTVAERCTNKRFQKQQFAPVEVFKTEKKGLGLRAAANIPYGEFILEYVGEVLDSEEFDKRADHYSQDKNIHYYFMSLRSDAIIDATMKGNISRFINHSCEPNAETQKWTVNGELRIGFFSTRTILAGEEITFDYRFQRYGKEAQKCLCEAPSCRGWLGEQPDDDSEDEDDEDEVEDQDEFISKGEICNNLIQDNISKCDDINEGLNDCLQDTTKKSDKDNDEIEIIFETKKKVFKRKPRKELFEDLDQLNEDINMLVTTGLKNQAHTLKLSRLMVRAKDTGQRQKLLRVLRRGELPCRRLFLDYHGLKLMHGYMIDAQDLVLKNNMLESLRLELLQTLAVLPIQNKTMLQDSKVLPTVEDWANGQKLNSLINLKLESCENTDTNINTLNSESTSQNAAEDYIQCEIKTHAIILDQLEEIKFLASKLLEEWASLKESFRIPKKERIEQMKEHEREANRKFLASSYGQEQDNSRKSDHRHRSWLRSKEKETKRTIKLEDKPSAAFLKISKHERRKLFALQVELKEEERRLKQREMWRQHELNCMLIGTDPRFTAPFDPNRGYQYIWNPQIGQWQNLPLPNESEELSNSIQTSQGASGNVQSASVPTVVSNLPHTMQVTIDEDVSKVKFLGPIPSPVKLPLKWKCAKDKFGRPYYYHVVIRKSQWEPPLMINEGDESSNSYSSSDTSSLSSDTSSDKSDSDEIDDTLLLMEVRKQMDKSQKFPEKVVPQEERNIENRDVECSPDTKTASHIYDIDENNITDNLERLSSIDIRLKEQFDVLKDDQSPPKKKRLGLCQEIVISPRTEEDKLQFREDLKRYKANKDKLKRQKVYVVEQTKKKIKESNLETKRTKEKKSRSTFKSRIKEMRDWNSQEAKRIKETFRSNMATTVVGVLNAYRKLDCKEARITNTEDFKHLARKLTHFVMLKEMKHVEKIEDLTCTDNVKAKAREYIKKYMSKFGEIYIKKHDEPDFRE